MSERADGGAVTSPVVVSQAVVARAPAAVRSRAVVSRAEAETVCLVAPSAEEARERLEGREGPEDVMSEWSNGAGCRVASPTEEGP
jgi:hypothetical protein